MEKFIKSGKKGAILMSLGTNIKSNQLGNEKLEVILKTFAQLPDYNILWKFESEVKNLPIKPSKNVMVTKFLPQNDILAHSDIKAFVSHAGMLSTHEAMWHGKPVIGIPFFVDQSRNLQKSIKNEVAVKVDFHTLNIENFKASILTVLEDPKYAKNAQKISKLFQDKPEKPLEKALWWIEYAIRNPNLENLKSPTLKLGPFVSKSYDVLLALIAVFHVFVFASIKIIKFVFKNKKSKRKIE